MKTSVFWPAGLAGYDGFTYSVYPKLKQLYSGSYFFNYLYSGKIAENKYVARHTVYGGVTTMRVYTYSAIEEYNFQDLKEGLFGGFFFDLVKDIFGVENYDIAIWEAHGRISYLALDLKFSYIRVMDSEYNPMLPTYNAHYESDGEDHSNDFEFQGFGGYNLAIQKLDINKKPLENDTYIRPQYIIPEVDDEEIIDFSLDIELGEVYTNTVSSDFDWENRKIIIVLTEAQYNETAQIWVKGGFHTDASFCYFVASANLHDSEPYPESMTINSQIGNEDVLDFNIFRIISDTSGLPDGIKIECNFPVFVTDEDETTINIETKLTVATGNRTVAENWSYFQYFSNELNPYYQGTFLNMSFSQDESITLISGFANTGGFGGALEQPVLNLPQTFLSDSDSTWYSKPMIISLGTYSASWESPGTLSYYTTPRIWNNNWFNIDYDSLAVQAISYSAHDLTKGSSYTFDSSTSEFHYLGSTLLDYGIRESFSYSIRSGTPIARCLFASGNGGDVYLGFYAINHNYYPITLSGRAPRLSRLIDLVTDNVDIHSGCEASKFSFTFHRMKTNADRGSRIINLFGGNQIFFDFNAGGNSYALDARDPYNPEKRGSVFYDGNSMAVSAHVKMDISPTSYIKINTLEIGLDKIALTIPKKHVKVPLGRISTFNEDYSVSLEYDIIPAPIAAQGYTELLGNVKFENVKLKTKNNNSGIEIIQNVSNPEHAYILCQLPKNREYSFFGMKGKLFLFFSALELHGYPRYIVDVMKNNFDPVKYIYGTTWRPIRGTVYKNKTYIFTDGSFEGSTGISVFCIEDNSNTFVRLGAGNRTKILWCGVLNGFLTFITSTVVGIMLEGRVCNFKSFYDTAYLTDNYYGATASQAHVFNENCLSAFGQLFNVESNDWEDCYMKMYIKVSTTINVEFVKVQNVDDAWDVSGIYDESCFYVKT